MIFTEESTTAAFLLRARREGMRDFGACMAPMTAFQILQGIETLPLRMQRHVENTRKIVAFLAAHDCVASVGYPELPGASRPRARASAAAARLRRGVQLRHPRHAGSGTQVHRVAEDFLAPGQRRRRQVAGDPSRERRRTSASRPDDSPPPASPRARSGCRSASRTPTT